MNIIEKFIKSLKIRKRHLDWVAGLLSIPVLITVITLNLTNLNSQKTKNNTTSPQTTEKVIVVPQENNEPSSQPTNATCKKEIGPISVSNPKEGDTVSDNPVYITIKYNDSDYCSVVWSYRINSGSWSEYNSNSPSLYNLPNGNVKFELRIQSTVSQDTDSLLRNFIYTGSPTSTPSAQDEN